MPGGSSLFYTIQAMYCT